MSIKSLFENIANAIKNVYGTTDTLTPAEMPEAITNFNSIFQTKNLSAPISGQTTVEGCLSSLSSDLSELENHTIGSQVNITSYDRTNLYTCPDDGYIMVTPGSNSSITAHLCNVPNFTDGNVVNLTVIGGNGQKSIFVRKETKVAITISSGTGYVYYFPLV